MAYLHRYLLVFTIVYLVGAGCGGSTAATQFDDPDLNDNSAKIQSDVTEASLVITGTITSIGTAPTFWSGIAWSTQPVTYAVDSVLKGSYEGSEITVYHLVVDGSRQADDTPGLSPAIFAEGNKLIMFLMQNPDYVDLGSGWELPFYMDFDEDYGTIPYSAQNEAVIKNMITSSTSTSLDIVDTTLATGGSSPAKTLTVNGDAADVTSFNSLLDACKEQSSTLNDLVSMIQNSEDFDVTLNIQRDPANVFVDSFNGRIVDIDDLEKWHEGCNDKTDLCQLFGHILQEYWHASVTGDGYGPSHESALDTENQIRSDLGKTTTMTGHTGARMGGDLYCKTTYNGTTELVKIGGGANPYPESVTVQVTPPAAPVIGEADNSTSCQITVTWTDSSDDEDGFAVERRDQTAGGDWEELTDSVPADTTTWTNSLAEHGNLTLGHVYCYRIRAFRMSVDTTAYSAYSAEACAEKQ